MKKEDLPPLDPNTAPASPDGRAPVFGDKFQYQEEHFLDIANQLLRDQITPMVHEQARQLMHEGHPCVMRHLVDSHLSSMDNDPVGIKLFVARKGSDRHEFEQHIHNRDFIRPNYFLVIADPAKKTIEIEFYRGDHADEKVNYYEQPLSHFDINRVRLGLLRFTENLP